MMNPTHDYFIRIAFGGGYCPVLLLTQISTDPVLSLIRKKKKSRKSFDLQDFSGERGKRVDLNSSLTDRSFSLISDKNHLVL